MSENYRARRSRTQGEWRRARQKRIRERKRRRQRQRRLRMGIAAALCVILCSTVIFLIQRGGEGSRASKTKQADTPGMSMTGSDTLLDAAAQARIEEVRVRCATNCTREQPTGLTDPAEYGRLGRELMEHIADNCSSWKGFENAQSFSYAARKDASGETIPYLLAVNRAANTVTVLSLDERDRYTVPYMAMICSTGTYTPLGFFTTDEKHGWLPLFQEVYGQYATHIVDDILFHSVPYYNPNKDDLEYGEYNKLGTAASLGCVRMQAVDVKWVYDNCPLGTPVVIYDDAHYPGPMGKPGSIKLNTTDTDTKSSTYRGFDPTDPDRANPWDEVFRSGTAIRSDAAQEAWDAAQANGQWNKTINPTDLRGKTTDATSRKH